MSASSSTLDNERMAGGDASARVFSREEFAEHDGSVPGRPILIAYRGWVYDVSGLFMWMTGRHFWLRAGRDLTGRMRESPHGEDMLRRARCVGRLAGNDNAIA
jgi:predicted heme/steroid binding protein